MNCTITRSTLVGTLMLLGLLTPAFWGQSRQPYPHATTEKDIIPKRPMAPPAINVRFNDPDFGTQMVRVTDENTDPTASGATFQASAPGKDEWSRDGHKFYVNTGGGGVLAFGFDPETMAIESMGRMKAGQRVPAATAARCHLQPSGFGFALRNA